MRTSKLGPSLQAKVCDRTSKSPRAMAKGEDSNGILMAFETFWPHFKPFCRMLLERDDAREQLLARQREACFHTRSHVFIYIISMAHTVVGRCGENIDMSNHKSYSSSI